MNAAVDKPNKSIFTCFDLEPKTKPIFRLFCFPYAGGSAVNFKTWHRHMPAKVEVLALTIPGRKSLYHTPPFTEMSPLVDSVVEAILPHLDLPFSFFGHSMGALVSFEVAQRLRQIDKNYVPEHLFVGGCWAPQFNDALAKEDDPDMSDEGLLEALRVMGGTPEILFEEETLLKLFLPALRADFQLGNDYIYQQQPPLDCPITAFGGLDDPFVNRGNIDAWREQTAAKFKMHMLQGNHFFMHSHERPLLSLILRDLI